MDIKKTENKMKNTRQMKKVNLIYSATLLFSNYLIYNVRNPIFLNHKVDKVELIELHRKEEYVII